MSLYPLKIVEKDEKGLYEDVRKPAINDQSLQAIVNDMGHAKVVPE